MPKKRIFCIGCAFPGDEFESVDFASSQTLLDADIILFQPNFGSPYIRESYNGQPLLSEHDSFHVRQYLAHWRSEIVAAVNAGKLVVIFLAKPLNYLRYTGEKQFSGSGRSRVTTNLVSSVSSYEAVPNLKNVVPKSGSEVRLEKGGEYLAPYWREFSGLSKMKSSLKAI